MLLEGLPHHHHDVTPRFWRAAAHGTGDIAQRTCVVSCKPALHDGEYLCLGKSMAGHVPAIEVKEHRAHLRNVLLC